MWKTLEELEKYLYMSQYETLRLVGHSLVTLVEQEIEARVDRRGLRGRVFGVHSPQLKNQA